MYRQFDRDFFDLIIVDECHRGSASSGSSWRAILEHFSSAAQIGMTATPKRDDTVDTYEYFGEPIYEYSLAQGIDDGFLAPYRVRRVVLSPDAMGFAPDPGQLDLFGNAIPPDLYTTKDFERVVSLLSRTEAAAKHLTDYLKRTNRMGKTIVFCVDSEHADQMRRALHNANSDITKQHPNYVVRIVSDEGDIGRGHLSDLADTEKEYPVIATTSQLLSTGVDLPTVRNVVLFKRSVRSRCSNRSSAEAHACSRTTTSSRSTSSTMPVRPRCSRTRSSMAHPSASTSTRSMTMVRSSSRSLSRSRSRPSSPPATRQRSTQTTPRTITLASSTCATRRFG